MCTRLHGHVPGRWKDRVRGDVADRVTGDRMKRSNPCDGALSGTMIKNGTGVGIGWAGGPGGGGGGGPVAAAGPGSSTVVSGKSAMGLP